MLQLGEIRIDDHEILRVSGNGQRLVLTLRWSHEELPLLLDLAGELLLSWYATEDRAAGIPVVLQNWSYRHHSDSGALRLLLECVQSLP